ncbi:LacI family DNA-binding transcriptional regulator [Streptomyces sp. VRA16 Mangrove soil]|uniref:LacI family DNA-binding transcriptional regulator n=1 Tax=Streptomyces sp. VRA16 Mangrove soil TaxID=2817434 RepID=UPI001A9F86B5|nr:LacI family DNA-binding transcriptional regulator [Streptomyces sp. VRA16 Mangrove soil]MBO1330735.1 LacI family DNA-binding transcriptional regulator [Streptomyces sp. VRA16 Mangrove soil]
MPTPRTSRNGARRSVTIEDVARSAGVSRQTVSRAINDKPEIDPQTRAHVLQVAQTLGYRPNRHARGMAGSSLTTLGLVVADVLNPFFPEVVAGVMDAADERGWQVAVYSTGSALEREQTVAATIADHVDACIGYFDDDTAVERVRASGIPLVLLDHDTRPPGVGGVRIDFEAGMRQALGHLTGAGHRRIVMLDDQGRDDAAAPRTRHHLFRSLVTEYGLDPAETWVVPVANSVQGGADGMDRVLADHPDATAVLGYNDLITVGALRRARERGLVVPDDCAFVGCDGLALAELVEPPLTTLYVDKRQVGRAAVEQVAALLRGGPAQPETVIVPSLVVRQST